MTVFPRIFEEATCPLPGYEGYSFRVLANPTAAEKMDWQLGGIGAEDCQECARERVQRGKSKAPITALEHEQPARVYCRSCQEQRDRMGRASVAIYGESRVAGFDFSTAEAALATFGQPELPDELLLWLYMLPVELWSARQEDMRKKLPFSSRIGS